MAETVILPPSGISDAIDHGAARSTPAVERLRQEESRARSISNFTYENAEAARKYFAGFVEAVDLATAALRHRRADAERITAKFMDLADSMGLSAARTRLAEVRNDLAAAEHAHTMARSRRGEAETALLRAERRAAEALEAERAATRAVESAEQVRS